MELDRRGAELLFQVLTEREERNSVAIASNESFSGWAKTFTDPRLCAGHRRPAHLRRPHHRDRHTLLPVTKSSTWTTAPTTRSYADCAAWVNAASRYSPAAGAPSTTSPP